MTDHRLMGTWISDMRKTLQWARDNGLINHPKAKFLKTTRHPLYLAYGTRYVHYLFRGDYDKARYCIVAKDDTGDLGTVEPCSSNKQRLWHTVYEGNRYWVMVDGVYREYFRKISNRNLIRVLPWNRRQRGLRRARKWQRGMILR